LQTQFGIEENEAAEILSNLRLISPYGKVGRLPWETGNTVPFGADIAMDHEKLFSLSGDVRTYTEQNLSVSLLTDIRSAMDKARVVVFLGFGFHQQNMKILQAGTGAPWRRILGTVLGIAADNYETLKLQIAQTTATSQTSQIQLLPRTSFDLLTTMQPSLMAAL
jgi:hypothetical protein